MRKGLSESECIDWLMPHARTPEPNIPPIILMRSFFTLALVLSSPLFFALFFDVKTGTNLQHHPQSQAEVRQTMN